jgi:hypothetical protein
MALAACANMGGGAATNTSSPAAAAGAAAPATEAQMAPPPANGAYTDAQLRAFAAASHDIQPLSAQLSSSDAAAKSAAVAQVRAILARNNLDSATYNAIAAQAQSDPVFAARIAALTAPHGS